MALEGKQFVALDAAIFPEISGKLRQENLWNPAQPSIVSIEVICQRRICGDDRGFKEPAVDHFNSGLHFFPDLPEGQSFSQQGPGAKVVEVFVNRPGVSPLDVRDEQIPIIQEGVDRSHVASS